LLEVMMKRFTLALAIAFPIAALAQPSPNPADPKAAAAPLRYESAFAGYRAFQEQSPAPWKQVNEEVKGVSGHAVHSAPKKDSLPQPLSQGRGEQKVPPQGRGEQKVPSQGTAEQKPAKPAEHKH
jgi:hypothetical protein